MSERLTYRAENGWVGVNSFDKTVSPTSVAIHKLAVFEDIMDKYEIETVEELDAELQDRLDYKFLLDECNKLQQDRDTWKKACELACQETPFHCPNPPERYNAQNEYGSDEPYYIEEGGCEFSDAQGLCLNCQIQYYYNKAQEEKENKND